MFERFTDRARRAVVTAQEEARMLGHNHIGSEHLLLGVLHVLEGEQAEPLAAAGITVEAARAQVREASGLRDKSPGGHIPFTQRAKKVLELSLREALEQDKGYISEVHILLAVLRDADDLGAQVAQRLGGPLPALREQVLAVAEAAPAEAEDNDPREPGDLSWRPARGWSAPGYGRTARFQREPEPWFSAQFASIDRRLAGLERHLGITDDSAGVGGTRGLVIAINRRLAAIERHLGVQPEAGAGRAGESAPGEPETEPE